MTLPLSAKLIAQRTDRTLLAPLAPELIPTDLASAYQVQTETVSALGPVGAWKVQPYPDNAEPLAAPIPAATVFQHDADIDLNTSAQLLVEAEVAVVLKADLPGIEGGYSVEQVSDAIDTAHLALEILASRFADPAANPALVGIADLQNNGAVVVGPAIPFADLPEVGTLAMNLLVDGASLGTVESGPTTERTLRSLTWLANHAAERGLSLKAGDVIITGARIGALPFDGKVLSIEAPGFAPVRATLA